MRVTHIPVDLSLRRERSDRVDNDDIDGTGADHGLGDLKRLLSRIRLGNIEIIDIDADISGVDRIQSVLRIDKSRNSSALLNFCDHMQRNGRFSAGLRSVDLNDPALGDPAEPERYIERERPCRDHFDIHLRLGLSELHHRSLAEFLLKVADRCFQRLDFFSTFFFAVHCIILILQFFLLHVAHAAFDFLFW